MPLNLTDEALDALPSTESGGISVSLTDAELDKLPATDAFSIPQTGPLQFKEAELSATPLAAPEVDEPTGDTVTGIMSGLHGMQSNFGSTLEMAGQLTGSTGLLDAGRRLKEDAQSGRKKYQPRISRLEDIEGENLLETLGNAMDYIQSTFGQALPSLGASTLGGIAGGLLAAPIPIPGARVAGALAGSTFVSYILNAGEIYADQIEAGVSPDEAARVAGGGGVISAILDALPATRIANKIIFRPARKVAGRTLLRRVKDVGKEGVITGLGEGAAETGQEFVKKVARTITLDESPFTAEAFADYLNAGVAGVIGGAPVGAGVSLLSQSDGGSVTPAPTGGLTAPPVVDPLRPDTGGVFGPPGPDTQSPNPLPQDTPFGAEGEALIDLDPDVVGFPQTPNDFPQVAPDPIPDPVPVPEEDIILPEAPLVGSEIGGVLQAGDILAAAGPRQPGVVNIEQVPEANLIRLAPELFEDMIEFSRAAEPGSISGPKIKRARTLLKDFLEATTGKSRKSTGLTLLKYLSEKGFSTSLHTPTNHMDFVQLIGHLARLEPTESLRTLAPETLVRDVVANAVNSHREAEAFISFNEVMGMPSSNWFANIGAISREWVARGENIGELVNIVASEWGVTQADAGRLFEYLSPGVITGPAAPLKVASGYAEALARYNTRKKALEVSKFPNFPGKAFLGNLFSGGSRERARHLVVAGTAFEEKFESEIEEFADDLEVTLTTDRELKPNTLLGDFIGAYRARKGKGEVYLMGELGTSNTRKLSIMHTLKHWIDKYLPGLDIHVISLDANRAYRMGVGEGTDAGIYSPRPGVVVLFLKEEMEISPGNFEVTISDNELFGLLAHEFGHMIVAQKYYQASQGVRNAIKQEYFAWIKTIKKMTNRDFVEAYAYPAEDRLQHLLDDPDRLVGEYLTEDGEFGDYLISFDEFLGQQVARSMMWRADAPKSVKKFFSDMFKALKDFYAEATNKNYAPAKTVDKWLKMLAAESDLRMLREGKPGQTIYGNPAYKTYAPGVFAEAEIYSPLEEGMKKIVESKTSKEEIADNMVRLGSDLDKYGWFTKLALTLLQIADRNKHIAPLQNYMELTQQWWASKSKWTSRANETLNDIAKFGSTNGVAQQDALTKLIYDATLRSFELKRRLTNEELIEAAQKFGVEQAGLDMFFQIDGDFREYLQELEQAMIDEARATIGPDSDPSFPDAMEAKITKDFADLHSRHYFPLSRFGNYVVTVRATRDVTFDGKEFTEGQLVWFETFETPGLGKMWGRKKELPGIQKRFASDAFIVGQSILPSEAHAYIGFPPVLLDLMSRRMSLTDEQKNLLKEISIDLNPTQSFRKHMLNRTGVMGFSMDMNRVYAQYFMTGSNHLARLKFAGKMAQEVDNVKSQGVLISNQGGDATKRGQINDWMREHLNYVLNPGNEWAHVRSFEFLWKLGANIKSAVVNLTQVPMVTFPHLAEKYGTVKSTRELTKAIKDIKFLMIGKPESLNDIERGLFEQAHEVGFIDESLASEVAGVTEGNLLTRAIAQKGPGRALKMFGSWAAVPFQLTEKANRRLTFLATIRLELAKGSDADTAFLAGRFMVQTTQFEYARWNRPVIMRGKKSIFFIFQMYVQHMMYLAFGPNPARLQFWASLLIWGGMMGLPGAEDALKAISLGSSKLRKFFGIKDPRISIEESISKELYDFFGPASSVPEYFMHGISRKTFGLHAIGQAVGLPIPALDFSTSITMGRISGFSEVINIFDDTGRYNTDVVRGVSGMLGPVASDALNFLKALTTDHPDPFIRWERAMPTALRSVSRAYRYSQDEAAVTAKGDVIVEFQPDDMEHQMELLGQMFGVTPTRLSRKQSHDWAARQAAEYWSSRREILMQHYSWARMWGDKDYVRSTLANVRKYNRSIPFPEMRLSRRDLNKSARSRLKNRRLRERGLGTNRRFRRLRKGVQESFGEQ